MHVFSVMLGFNLKLPNDTASSKFFDRFFFGFRATNAAGFGKSAID